MEPSRLRNYHAASEPLPAGVQVRRKVSAGGDFFSVLLDRDFVLEMCQLLE